MQLSTRANESAELLAGLLASSDSVVAFTGAGISTESGIPDFRSPGSAWKHNSPLSFQDFLTSEALQVEAWRRKFAMDDLYRGAQPSTGHKVLARLAHAGRLDGVITQNIDGLHHDSGLTDEQIVELHGNGTYAKCLVCGVRLELAPIREKLEATGKPPRCLCGGIVKAGTISFGQSMPQTEMRRAQKLSQGCDLFIAIGSSLVVYPAAGFPVIAKESGARLVIINREPTGLDAASDFVLRGEIGEILGPFAAPGPLN